MFFLAFREDSAPIKQPLKVYSDTSKQTNNYCINLHRSAREMKDYDISGMPFGGGFVCDQVNDARRNLCSLIEAQSQQYSDFCKRLDAEMARRLTIQ